MENYIWLIAIAGGAALLGGAIAFGMFKESPRRTAAALGGAAGVLLIAIVVSLTVSEAPSTASSNPSDRQGAQYDAPARPSDQNALPGLDQPNR